MRVQGGAHFEDSNAEQFAQLSALFKEALLRMRTTLNAPTYNFVLHSSPLNGDVDNYYHWHIEIMPKLTKIAGFEQGTLFYINPTLPEEAAEILRKAKI